MVLSAWPVFVPFVFLYLVIKMHKASVKKNPVNSGWTYTDTAHEVHQAAGPSVVVAEKILGRVHDHIVRHKSYSTIEYACSAGETRNHITSHEFYLKKVL
jgi:hypothetical protein